MGKGNLLIQARTANNAVPLSGVQITIMDDQDRVLYQLTTDDSGNTTEVSLETVDKDLSLDPNYPYPPYISYQLVAEKEGFNRLHIIDVQIFDGETAVQPIILVPMLEDQPTPITEELFIGNHAVEMGTVRNQLEPETSPYILPYVVIPEKITVHLGTPTSSAANVQVSFPDYVKNVASGEIYPTWPRASLEANIYAIITFALNRIFTEWYRSRGYNFDITNSTAYDQYFVYERTVYESISVIVDDIFNQYVRRPNQDAPYFTSFCNGTTATCSGMSQWGTVTLANQGMSALQILRHYYPADIEIAQTDIISSVLVSYPGTPLRLGSTGFSVETIQTYLTRIRRNYPAITQITDETGVFGSTTQEAVRVFQRVFSLSVDGVVGKATWNKISSIYAAIARLAELDSEGTLVGVGTVPPSTVLSLNSNSIDVITLQYILCFISEFYVNIPCVAQDGYFDDQTQLAVMAFQRMMGMNADGVVGATTWNALYDTYWGIKENVPMPEPDAFEYTVQAGDTLWLLAQKFGTTVDAIISLNNLNSDVIIAGQVLKIPAAYTSYTVQNGDTLWLLAQRFGSTVDEIKRLNNLTTDDLSIGLMLRIPGNFAVYTVQPDDTLWLLAQRFGTSVERIKAVNGLNSDVLMIGQILYIS